MMKTIQATDVGFWLFTQQSSVYFPHQNLPQGSAQKMGVAHLTGIIIGQWQGQNLWLVLDLIADKDYTFLRELLHLPEAEFRLLSRGVELNYFLQTHRFCGKCGSKTYITPDEWAVQCENSACEYRTYPVISPSIIVAVRRSKEILLACHKRHQNNKIYTTLAGFVEVGETFEQTVEREVFEETGIKIKNIRYFGSQPWAFPHSQMVGFLADYDSGEIRLQEVEIDDAQWFRYDQPLPNLPPQGTIALELINATLSLCAKE